MTTIETHWPTIRRLFEKAFQSSLHYSIASVNEDGSPHVTPIGSLVLTEPGKGVYFEKFTHHMPDNFKKDERVCILAVRSGFFYWLTSLFFGRFSSPPALRLTGKMGQKRKATPEEIRLWNKRTGPLKFLKGYGLLWNDMNMVREIQFDGMLPVHLGIMTKGHWENTDAL